MEVLFCRENLATMGDAALDLLTRKAGDKLRIQVIKCIIACSECASQHIARVNGELIVASSADELVNKILRLATAAN